MQPNNNSQRERARSYLAEHGWSTPTEVARALGGMTPAEAATLLSALAKSGGVRRVDRGVYELVGEVVRSRVNPQREAIRAALAGGEKTVEQLAAELGLRPGIVNRHCTAMVMMPSHEGRTKPLARVGRRTYALVHFALRPKRLVHVDALRGRPPHMNEDTWFILRRCSEQPLETADLADLLDVDNDAARYRARLLANRGLLSVTHHGRHPVYSTSEAGLEALARHDAEEVAHAAE